MEKFGYKKIKPEDIEPNLIKLVEKEWMLVTAGTGEKINTMTANWGGMGYLWNRPVVFIFIRPERYTYEFVENNESFTLTFFDEKYRNSLDICVTKSGRDCDKIAEASLTPLFSSEGNPAFEEAGMILECKKLYAGMLRDEEFLDTHILSAAYGLKGNLHKLYIAEIKSVWIK